jgi:transposase
VIFPSNRVRIMVATKPIDFRKGHDSLAAMVKNELRKDPFTGTVFVFRAKKADRLKLLYWDGTGLVFAIGLERMATRWLTLQAAGRAQLHLACRQGRADADEPRAVRGAVSGAGLAAGSGP